MFVSQLMWSNKGPDISKAGQNGVTEVERVVHEIN